MTSKSKWYYYNIIPGAKFYATPVYTCVYICYSLLLLAKLSCICYDTMRNHIT